MTGCCAALIFHSDRLELSEQFDRTTGFEKSVANLTWSYAAFLSAVARPHRHRRARLRRVCASPGFLSAGAAACREASRGNGA